MTQYEVKYHNSQDKNSSYSQPMSLTAAKKEVSRIRKVWLSNGWTVQRFVNSGYATSVHGVSIWTEIVEV
jgi:hypothetical protein